GSRSTYDPAWLSDATTIAFGASQPEERLGAHIYATAPVDGAPVQQLTSGTRADSSPTWSPDGKWIAFEGHNLSSAPDGGYFVEQGHIYMVSAVGSELRQVTSGSNEDSSPTWSPSGKWIAFARQGTLRYSRVDDMGEHIYVMNADGSEV